MAAEEENSRGATFEESAVSANAKVQSLRYHARPTPAGDAVGKEAGLREQSRARRRRGRSRLVAVKRVYLRLVSALPDPHPRHAKRGLTMMVKGKMGSRGRRARPQIEPFAQGRGPARRQDHLLMEIVADHAAVLAGSKPVRSRSSRDSGVLRYRKSLSTRAVPGKNNYKLASIKFRSFGVAAFF